MAPHDPSDVAGRAYAIGWSLPADDVAALDEVALEGRVSVQRRFRQHG